MGLSFNDVVAVEVFLNSLPVLTVLLSQLLKSLFTKDVFLKEYLSPFTRLALPQRGSPTLFAQKPLYTIIGSTVFYYPARATFTALFFVIGKRIDYSLPKLKLGKAWFINTFLQLDLIP